MSDVGASCSWHTGATGTHRRPGRQIAALEADKASAVAAQDFFRAGDVLEDIKRLKEQRSEMALASSTSSADTEAARQALEAALMGRGGVSVAEALAENEYASHCRVQALCGQNDVEKAGLLRLLGRQVPRDAGGGEEATILHAFPWRGEDVRMALPTSLPPTLASWAEARARGATPGAKFDGSVPRQGLQERGRFVRAALRGALTGLDTLHGAGLVHQSLGPGAVLLSTADDRKAERAQGWLTELGFCRDARSLELCYRASDDGTSVLPAFEGSADVLDAGLLERACRRCVRPGDPDERARFGRADDMREFGMLVLSSVLLPNADPAGAGAGGGALDAVQLRALCDGPFAADDDGLKTDGVDVERLRAYLDADERLRLGGVGGVDVLDVGGAERSGWDLLAALLAARWEDRPSAAEALQHPWWQQKMFF